MKRYTETVVDWMIRQNVINEKEKELYFATVDGQVLTFETES